MRMIAMLLGILSLAASSRFVLPEARSQAVDAKSTNLAKFSWVNRLPESKTPLLRHGTFFSPSNGAEVGYYIYLPPGYESAELAARRYPVVYYLHGGRPGGEQLSINMVDRFHEAISSGRVPPMIYVFVNGGLVSHYDYPAKKSFGEAALHFAARRSGGDRAAV
jgi:enterochelin esterase-like enzyme